MGAVLNSLSYDAVVNILVCVAQHIKVYCGATSACRFLTTDICDLADSLKRKIFCMKPDERFVLAPWFTCDCWLLENKDILNSVM